MDEEYRQKLVEKRRKEQKEKEFLNDIGKDLSLEEKKLKREGIRNRYENEYVDKIILFFGTLTPLYLFFYMVGFIFDILFGKVLVILDIDISWLTSLIHLVIWGVSIYSVYRDRSVLQDIVDYFA